ncbi:MAG: YafY family transcriptional regulator [Hyphomonadaceae bacterium]|nr:YafY family transcriptional regulator [Hyphomonadaceae bacterium]
MRRADRLFEIIQILRREKAPISAQAIADEMETSKRTIYRDIATLMAQRVPITGEPGMGYVLGRGFDMPALMLNTEEIEAAVLGANWVATRGEPEFALAARNLIAKLHAVIPERLRPTILAPSTSVAPIRQAAEKVSAAELRSAIRSGVKVEIAYRREDGRATQRVVWPILLGYRDLGRILAAWCELRRDFRYFRTDRMDSLKVLGVRYPERPAALKKRWERAMAVERRRFVGE